MVRIPWTRSWVRPGLAALGFFLCLSRALALEPASDPALAVVRIQSHGASGTIIATTEGTSWILSCAHMFFDKHNQLDPRALARPFKIDGPAQPYAPKTLATVKILAVDPVADLSLLEISNGPFHYVPVARRGYQPSTSLRSLGYDHLSWPVTNHPATLVGLQGDWLLTREKPWPGRSGGGLIDLEGPCLLGVVCAYETKAPQRGIYVRHAAILRFLDKHQQTMPRPPQHQPPPAPRQRYTQPHRPPLPDLFPNCPT